MEADELAAAGYIASDFGADNNAIGKAIPYLPPVAAFVFYGPGPDAPEAIAAIKAPVYGFYAGNDARIGATVPKTQELMKAAGKARDAAWVRWKSVLAKL
jgi:dienelactone hydrolase